MAGAKIDGLNEGLRVLKTELMHDELASRRVELAIITFGDNGVSIVQDFITAANFEPPFLHSDGSTPMGRAIEEGLELLRLRKGTYRANGVAYYRPWIFLITDGQPTDSTAIAAARVQAEEAANGLAFFAVGVEGASVQSLAQISAVRPPVKLKGLSFRELFQWLSASQSQVSSSRVGEQVLLPPVNWGTV